MNFALYINRNSKIHNLPIWIKFVFFFFMSFFIYFLSLKGLAACLIGTLFLFKLAHIKPNEIASQIKPLIYIFIIIFSFQYLFTSLNFASITILRFLILVLVAILFTLTTKLSDMSDAIIKGLTPFQFIGINPQKIGLAIVLVIRFIPMLQSIHKEIKEAQLVRGHKNNIISNLIPLISRILLAAETIAEAIDSRTIK